MRSHSPRRAAIQMALLLSALAALLLAGREVTLRKIDSGLSQFAADSIRGEVAHTAYVLALGCLDPPQTRLLYPTVRVEAVEFDPEFCPGGGYRPLVRRYTFFGLPAATYHMACNHGMYCW